MINPAPVWLITGCSSGLGRELARAVLLRGWNAVVTARDPATVQDIVAAHPASALALQLDVTVPTQIAGAVRNAEEKFGAIDVLVNNAGFGYRSALEEAEDADIRRVFEVNFFGPAAMTRAVLPGMRARQRGYIVNVSSIAGRFAPEGSAFYAASKFAVGGMSDALRKELQPLGIGVLLVEPGPLRTAFAGASLQQSRRVIDAYASTAGLRRKEAIANDPPEAGDPARGAAAIIEALAAESPPFRLLLGRVAVRRARAVLDEQRREIDAWEAVALATDYPQAR